MTDSRPLPEKPSLDRERADARELAAACARREPEALTRVEAWLPERAAPISDSEARYVVAREYGFDDWAGLCDAILDRERGLEWAVREARRAIAANDHGELERIVTAHPALLRWRDPDARGEVLLQATTSYANFPGPDAERMWNRPDCAKLLLERGAVVDPRVPLRMLTTGAHEMIALFAAQEALPDNLRVRAARGALEPVCACFDDHGNLLDVARPSPELRTGYPNAEDDWPEPDDDAAILADAFLFACRLGQREVASWLLERACELDRDLAERIERSEGRAAFVDFLLAETPEGARYDLRRGGAPGPNVIWQCAVDLRLLKALHARDVEAVRTLLANEPFLLDERRIELQARFLEVASYAPDSGPILEAFFASEPAIATASSPPGRRSISYALEYGYADYLRWLEPIWGVPDDLPHAAGRGDRAAVLGWFDDQGRPQLGDPSRHGPFPEHDPVVSVQNVLDRALAWAVQNREYTIADDLLERGADINTRWSTHEPASLLHECAFAGRLEQVRWLVQRGIDLTIEDSRFGSTAAGWAEFAGHDEIAAFLTEAASERDQ